MFTKEVLGSVLANEAKPKPEGYTDLVPIWFSVFFFQKYQLQGAELNSP